jgi:glyoxylase-like metal-dependent hydrolase (beta-lactamase superfamily II)
MPTIHSDPPINAIAEGVYQISLTPPLDGFSEFISAWVVTGRPSFLVDVGPASTAGQLLRGLDVLGVAHPDYILLTHIHLDHAGAARTISGRFPEARVVCHAKGIPHLVDPTQLWEGSRKVLGTIAEGYGPLEPIPAERFIAAQELHAESLAALLTPGHAAHHVSYRSDRGLFAGEACGVHYRLQDGQEYLRPATPPRFFLDVALASVDTLIEHAPSPMMIGHFGAVRDGATLLKRHRRQLLFWEEWLAKKMASGSAASVPEACAEGLLQEDPCLAAFNAFPTPAQKRERYFLKNSINGFLGWLENSKGEVSKAPGDGRQGD